MVVESCHDGCAWKSTRSCNRDPQHRVNARMRCRRRPLTIATRLIEEAAIRMIAVEVMTTGSGMDSHA